MTKHAKSKSLSEFYTDHKWYNHTRGMIDFKFNINGKYLIAWEALIDLND